MNTFVDASSALWARQRSTTCRFPSTPPDFSGNAAVRHFLPGRRAGSGDQESPDGPVIVVPVATGAPRLGEPSEFQAIFWARVVRVVPQPWLAEEFAW